MKITTHLSWSEVLRGSGYTSLNDVPDEIRAAMEETAEQVFEPIRTSPNIGAIKIVSGLRSVKANLAARGARRSRHMTGEALDLRPVRLPGERCIAIYDAAEMMQENGTMPKGGLCLYAYGKWGERDTWRPRFVHVDMRGRRARWHKKARWPDGQIRWTSLRQDNLLV